MASRDLAHARRDLAAKVRELQVRFAAANPGKYLQVTCTYRTPREQQELFAQGRTKPGLKVTWIDGVRKLSKHNMSPAEAVDLAVVDDPDGPEGPIKPVIKWKDRPAYLSMGEIAESLDLQWGGRWRKVDACHVEVRS